MICMYILYDGRRKCRYNNLAFMSDAFLHGRCFFLKTCDIVSGIFREHTPQKTKEAERKTQKREKLKVSSIFHARGTHKPKDTYDRANVCLLVLVSGSPFMHNDVKLEKK